MLFITFLLFLNLKLVMYSFFCIFKINFELMIKFFINLIYFFSPVLGMSDFGKRERKKRTYPIWDMKEIEKSV